VTQKGPLDQNTQWYKDAIIYQLHVKSFFDGNGDGIGDFKGLTQKLDYIEGLGATAIWLLPFYPSPQRDDGYDIADYFGINPAFGSLRDFKVFLREAHQRGLRVITELVLNHTSDQHAWFQHSRHAKAGLPWRDFYVWSDTPDKYRDARIIFKDFESSNWTWDPVAKAYFWHRFYSHQPDLNFENPRVHKAMFKVIDYWMEMGVDGLRLDAVPYLYEAEGTNCENLPATHAFLRSLRAHVDEIFGGDRLLLAEANQWPEDAVAYFGAGNECHMAFHFPLMPRMFMALQMEDSFPIIDILEQTPPLPESAQWAIFLRNHDELTLEMVTDEERDYMYRYYASDPSARINLGIRRRLAPLLNNSRRRMEILNMLLFSLPGTPLIYYGDELGMGDNHYLGDRNGVRTPMQWSADRNAGFSQANPQKLLLPIIIDPEYHYETINVETHEHNLSSMLWWMKRVIAMRKKHAAFARGGLAFVPSNNANVLSFVRASGDETILVMVNLSRFAQAVELDLSDYEGWTPVDLFSNNRFPVISRPRYTLTMGFHDYFWFLLKKPSTEITNASQFSLPEVNVGKDWTLLFNGKWLMRLEKEILPGYLQHRTSCGAKKGVIRSVEVLEKIPFRSAAHNAIVLFIKVGYTNASSDILFIPFCFSTEESIETAIKGNRGLIMARISGPIDGFVHDSAYCLDFHALLAEVFFHKKKIQAEDGFLECLRDRNNGKDTIGFVPHEITLLRAGRRNTSIGYDHLFYCKLYRRIEEGPHPEVELLRRLSAHPAAAPHVPRFHGELVYRMLDGKSFTLAMVTALVSNVGDAWHAGLAAAQTYFEEIAAHKADPSSIPADLWKLFRPVRIDPPQFLSDVLGMYGHTMDQLGGITGAMHQALAGDAATPVFANEPYSMLYQRSLYQSLQSLTKKTMTAFKGDPHALPEEARMTPAECGAFEKEVLTAFSALLVTRISGTKIRIHGHYQLTQLLAIGNTFVIKDFEGQPNAPLSERRIKRSPLRDAAAMLNSLHRCARVALYDSLKLAASQKQALEPWIGLWFAYAGNRYLNAYIDSMKSAGVLPRSAYETNLLVKLFLLEQAVSELGVALHNDPQACPIHVRTIRQYLAIDVPRDPPAV